MQLSKSARDGVATRGFALYDNVLKDVFEHDRLGETLAIHPESGGYTIARTSRLMSSTTKESDSAVIAVCMKSQPEL